jgi:hypothetical protein
MIAPHGLLHSHINLRGATLVTFGPLWIVAHTPKAMQRRMCHASADFAEGRMTRRSFGAGGYVSGRTTGLPVGLHAPFLQFLKAL